MGRGRLTESERRPLILDTHVWLWSVEGDSDRLSRKAVAAIEEAAVGGRIRIAAISVWEVAMLEARGRISLSRPLDEWVRAALDAPGTRLIGLDPAIALESARLPGRPVGDPADRMLIASARVTGARLATCDRAIIAYAGPGHADVLDAAP